MVAPADLTFHGVTNLVISIDYATSSAALQPMAIHEIHRSPISFPNGSSSFAWRIELNSPGASVITFHAEGFSQLHRKAAAMSAGQYLSASERSA